MGKLVRQILSKVTRHKLRHTPTGFRFAISDQIGSLDAARWDRATEGSSLFIGRPYLGALESAAPDNLSPRYALICRGDEPVAAVAAQVVGAEGKRWMKEGSVGIAKKVAAGLRARLLVC